MHRRRQQRPNEKSRQKGSFLKRGQHMMYHSALVLKYHMYICNIQTATSILRRTYTSSFFGVDSDADLTRAGTRIRHIACSVSYIGPYRFLLLCSLETSLCSQAWLSWSSSIVLLYRFRKICALPYFLGNFQLM